MDANTVITRGGQHVETLADDEIVLMHVDSGRFFTLRGTGRRVWELIAQPMAIGAVADHLVKEYKVEKDACIRDVVTLCEQLELGQLVDVAP